MLHRVMNNIENNNPYVYTHKNTISDYGVHYQTRSTCSGSYVSTGLTNTKTPVEGNEDHEHDHWLSLLNQAFCFSFSDNRASYKVVINYAVTAFSMCRWCCVKVPNNLEGKQERFSAWTSENIKPDLKPYKLLTYFTVLQVGGYTINFFSIKKFSISEYSQKKT